MSRNLEALIHDHVVVHLVIAYVFQLSRYKLSMDKPLPSMLLSVSTKVKNLFTYPLKNEKSQNHVHKYIIYLSYIINNIVKQQ